MSRVRQVVTLASVTAGWAVSSWATRRRRAAGKLHVLFCMCDHYEPGTGGVGPEVASGRVRELLDRYPVIADAHRDSDGCVPRRTWFYPPHYHRNGWLRDVVSLCERSYGEIELHLHHGKETPDTSENLRHTIRRCIAEYSELGIFGSRDGLKQYGFIHGDWALDNSRNGRFCGVNDELTVLHETGCYADFTFPCYNEASPSQINSLYYASDNRSRPKSFDRGRPVVVGGDSSGEVMIIQGPWHPYFRNGSWAQLRVFGDAVDREQRITPERIDAWLRTGISVRGREQWIVIKTHTHGATEADVVLGPEMHDLFSYLESKTIGRDGLALHYVTARELYNIIKAAEAGESDSDPAAFRDYLVKPPRYDSSVSARDASPTLRELVARTYRG